MDYRRLGANGLELSRIGLGCGNFGGIGSAPELFGQGETEAEAFALMDAAVAAGINFFDTAASYGGGRSERWIGRWRAERDAPVLLSTKVYWSVRGDPADRGLSRDRILREIKGSLSRLGVERVDMYLTHEPDAETPIEETLRALDELVRAGKAGAIGASNLDGEQLEEALATSSRCGLARFDWVQNEYSLLRREPEREKTFAELESFEAAAAERGVEPAALAIAWVLSHPQVTAVVVGPRRPEHLAPALAALELRLSPQERNELAELFA